MINGLSHIANIYTNKGNFELAIEYNQKIQSICWENMEKLGY